MLSPMLQVKDLQETISFYTDILGFTTTNSSYPEFATLCRDGVQIMIIVPHKKQDNFKPSLTGNLYMFTENVDELWEKIKDKVTVTCSIGDRVYNLRDFSILDNNGYELVFGQ